MSNNEFIPFNLNSPLKARLTVYGKEVYKKELTGLMSKNPNFKFEPPEEDAQGWSTWTAWEFINSFGPVIYNGAPKVCEPGVMIIPGKLAV